jgi:hypothetical protein
MERMKNLVAWPCSDEEVKPVNYREGIKAARKQSRKNRRKRKS